MNREKIKTSFYGFAELVATFYIYWMLMNQTQEISNVQCFQID